MADEEVYERFVEWLRTDGAYVPESQELLPLVKACYRPDEARLLTGMPFRSVGPSAKAAF